MPDYQVVKNGVLLGTLTRTNADMFWQQGVFFPTSDFDSIRSLFEKERELIDSDQMDAWQVVWEELAIGLVLEPLDGRAPIKDFLLHIENDRREAHWRY